MKYLISALLLLLTTISLYAQVNIVNVEKENTPSNERFINGISTKEDIGGVDVAINSQKFKHHFTYEVDNYGEFRSFYKTQSTPIGNRRDTRNSNSILPPQTLQVPSGITLTNYNPFPVTVLLEYAADYARKDWYYQVSDNGLKYNIQTVVLGADKTGEGVSKTIFITQYDYPIIAHISHITTITRKLGQ